MKHPETDRLLAGMIRELRSYRTARESHDANARVHYDEFRRLKRELYALWPSKRAKLLVRFAVARSGWSNPKVIHLD